MKTISVVIEDARYEGMRIDRYIAEVLHLFPRSRLKLCTVSASINGKIVKLSRPIRSGNVLEISYSEPPAPAYTPEEIPLDIVYEDDTAIVINKPQGLVVHPGSGVSSGTLVQGLLWRCRQMADAFREETIRPGIVHRLDKDTSGILIAAKNPDMLEFLSRQFKVRTTEKVYYAVVKGRLPKREGVISRNLTRDPANRKRFTVSDTAGKTAVTHYRVLKVYRGYSFVRLVPKTGRTHQLRVHMKAEGCPILGDPVYSRNDTAFPDVSLMLHAFRLSINLGEGEEIRTFRAPLPIRFGEVLARLDSEYRIPRK